MTNACHKKCVVPKYKDSELTKGIFFIYSSEFIIKLSYLGESICIDRCVAKYMEVHDRIGKQLTSMTLQQQPALQDQQTTDPSRAVGSFK